MVGSPWPGISAWIVWWALLRSYKRDLLVTVAARSKAWNVFARLKIGIVGSNPSRGMDVCLRLTAFILFVLPCVSSGLATGWSLVQGVLPTVYKCKIAEPHKEEAKARYGMQRHIRRRYERLSLKIIGKFRFSVTLIHKKPDLHNIINRLFHISHKPIQRHCYNSIWSIW
jgi:hypothetical protein